MRAHARRVGVDPRVKTLGGHGDGDERAIILRIEVGGKRDGWTGESQDLGRKEVHGFGHDQVSVLVGDVAHTRDPSEQRQYGRVRADGEGGTVGPGNDAGQNAEGPIQVIADEVDVLEKLGAVVVPLGDHIGGSVYDESIVGIVDNEDRVGVQNVFGDQGPIDYGVVAAAGESRNEELDVTQHGRVRVVTIRVLVCFQSHGGLRHLQHRRRKGGW